MAYFYQPTSPPEILLSQGRQRHLGRIVELLNTLNPASNSRQKIATWLIKSFVEFSVKDSVMSSLNQGSHVFTHFKLNYEQF
jgi:hypothetical protein